MSGTTNGRKWFFDTKDDVSFLVCRSVGSGASPQEHVKSNGQSYGKVTAVKEADANAMKKVL